MAFCGSCGPGGTASDSGATAICGDGTQDPDELCDDGNQIAGDGCSPECLPSGMPVDCVDLLVQDSLDDWDEVHDLLPLADGTFVAAGQRDAATDKRGWVARYEPSGAQRWLVDATSLDAGINYVSDLAGDDQAGIWALATGSSFSFDDRVIRFDQDGDAVGTVVVASETGMKVDVWDIEVTASGVWLAGELDGDAWLGLYDPMSNTVRDILREDHLGYEDIANVVVRDGDGVVVAATLSTSPNIDVDVLLMAKTDILVIWLDPEGHELQRTMVGPSPDPEFARYVTDIRTDGTGRWFVAGALSPFALNGRIQSWAAQIDGSWTWATSEVSGAGWGGMVPVDGGVVVAANRRIDDGTNVPYIEGWLGELELDGTDRWEFGRVGDGIENFENFRHGTLVRDAEGRVRSVGVAMPAGEPWSVRSCLISR